MLDIVTSTDYYPFGSLMPGRNASSGDYRYGFQGQEGDPEIKGEGNSVNYKYRMYDPRIGRFFAVDPLTIKFPQWSPFQFSGNRPIDMVELEGLEPVKAFNDNSPGREQIKKSEAKRLQRLYEKGIIDPNGWRPFEMTPEDKKKNKGGGSEGYYKEKPSIKIVKAKEIVKEAWFNIEYSGGGEKKLQDFIDKKKADIKNIEATAYGSGKKGKVEKSLAAAARRIFKKLHIKAKVKGKASKSGGKIRVKVTYTVKGKDKKIKTYHD